MKAPKFIELVPISKTSDIFARVKWKYGKYTWDGAIPYIATHQGVEYDEKSLTKELPNLYKLLHPKNRESWIKISDKSWNQEAKKNQTYLVLKALYSSEWECRVCGPTNINPQAAARIKSLKKFGYFILTETRHCKNCSKKVYHDILAMIPPKQRENSELRKPIPRELETKIFKVLDNREACFNVKRQSIELVIDHKFPSQRWIEPESDNKKDMSAKAIKKKFQLLTNQTNMWKSRFCDACVNTGKRGNYFGVKWYYKGNEKWEGESISDERGCIGCPWYDFDLWRKKINKTLLKENK